MMMMMIMMVVSWFRRRWVAFLVAAVTFAQLKQGDPSWLTVLGAAVVAYVLFHACVIIGAGGTFLWAAGRVSGLDRRAVLITGCDSGFGHASARRMHAAGVGRVFACVLDAGSAGAQALRELDPQRMRVIQCDVTNDSDVAAARAAVDKELRASECELWAVVNNAGVLALGQCEWMDIEHTRKVIDVNTLGQVRITQAFLPLLRKVHGRVVNVNSITSRLPAIVLTPYTMSKFAALAFTDSLRIDMNKFNVSVHSIEPMIVKTCLAESFFPLLQQTLEKLPKELKRDYGKTYWKILMKLCQVIYSLSASPTSGIEDVADSIEDACLCNYPENRYLPGIVTKLMEPCRSIIYTVQSNCLNFLFIGILLYDRFYPCN